MRYNEILKEFVIRLDNNVTIHRNPVRPQLINLFDQAQKRYSKESTRYPTLRGLMITGPSGHKVYIWDAFDGTHEDVFEKLNDEMFVEEIEYSSFYLNLIGDEIVEKHFVSYGSYQNNPRGYSSLRIEDHYDVLEQHIERWNE